MINESTLSIIVSLLILVCISIIVIYSIYISNLPSRECNYFNSLYSSGNAHLSPINKEDDKFSHTLKDYYIQSAFNCCSGGSYKNDYVSTCVLKNIIKQGARCLDFEIYNIDDKPVVATSTSESHYVKETYNYIEFSEIMDILVQYAFGNSSLSPCPTDPLFLHLRIKSSSQKMLKSFASLFQQYDNYFLGPEYSYEDQGKNIGNTKLITLCGKIILMVEKNNEVLDNPDFDEYVNITSNSIFMRELQYYDVKNTPDLNELETFNKTNMTIVIPNISVSNPENSNGMVCRESGCQFIAMRYQSNDEFLKEQLNYFNEYGSSFVLKPEHLRDIPIEIPIPPDQKPELSYAEREIKSDYYQFAM